MTMSPVALRDFLKAEAQQVAPLYDDVTWEVGITPPEIPGRFVLLTPVSGPGLQMEWQTDVGGLDVLVAGEQSDFVSGEELARWVDRTLLGGGGSRTIGDQYVVDLTRFGSAPYNTEQDDADRYRFACSYMLEVESGLALNQ